MSVNMVAEGDDTLSEGGAFPKYLIEALGLKLKSKVLRSFCDGDFCGITKTIGTTDLLTNPVKVICNMFVFPSTANDFGKNLRSRLLRAKALSIYYQYPQCPMVSQLCYAVLRKTRGMVADGRELSYHQAEVFRQLDGLSKFYQVPPMHLAQETRDNFEYHYKISRDEQLAFEADIELWGRNEEVIVRLPSVFEPYQLWSHESSYPERVRPRPPWDDSRLRDPLEFAEGRAFLMNKFLKGGSYLDCTRDDRGKAVKFSVMPQLLNPSRGDLRYG
jgi:hypothetical protein